MWRGLHELVFASSFTWSKVMLIYCVYHFENARNAGIRLEWKLAGVTSSAFDRGIYPLLLLTFCNAATANNTNLVTWDLGLRTVDEYKLFSQSFFCDFFGIGRATNLALSREECFYFGQNVCIPTILEATCTFGVHFYFELIIPKVKILLHRRFVSEYSCIDDKEVRHGLYTLKNSLFFSFVILPDAYRPY